MSDTSDQQLPTPVRVAVVLLVVEAAALLAAVGLLVDKTITGKPTNTAGALLGAALALAGAAVLAFGARALAHRNGAFRSPVVVIQLLAIPVAYDLAFPAGRVGYGAPILLVALATLFLLFVPASRAVLDRDLRRPTKAAEDSARDRDAGR
jgi:hypothetical protein